MQRDIKFVSFAHDLEELGEAVPRAAVRVNIAAVDEASIEDVMLKLL